MYDFREPISSQEGRVPVSADVLGVHSRERRRPHPRPAPFSCAVFCAFPASGAGSRRPHSGRRPQSSDWLTDAFCPNGGNHSNNRAAIK